MSVHLLCKVFEHEYGNYLSQIESEGALLNTYIVKKHEQRAIALANRLQRRLSVAIDSTESTLKSAKM